MLINNDSPEERIIKTKQNIKDKNSIKSIAIITEFTLNSVNYGNNVQAFAFNYYFRKHYPQYHVETLLLNLNKSGQITTWMYYVSRIKDKLKNLLDFNIKKKDEEDVNVITRRKRFNEFANRYISLSDEIYSYSKFEESMFDYFFVGSDVVWFQTNGIINKFKFLAFTPKNPKARKIAYAASFGENFIPEENKKYIYKYLLDFDMISVREFKSVETLKNIGIVGAKHVCDPTLLLSVEDWNRIADDVTVAEKYENKKYAFIYILGNNKKEKKIKEICDNIGIEPLFIDSNSTYDNAILKKYSIKDCSPQEWVWLIKHAMYVFTDSFHGLVFATIFKKPFLVVRRDSARDLNVRLTDYLETIGELEKLIDIESIMTLDAFKWDYDKINEKMNIFIESSKNFIDKSITNSED